MKYFALLVLPFAIAAAYVIAQAAPAKNGNYVVFNIKGDCAQEDCIAAVNDALQPQQDNIVRIDASSLASKQTTEYKTVVVIFKNLKSVPYDSVMSEIAALGYNVVSYVIHDTHTGQDVIIPH